MRNVSYLTDFTVSTNKINPSLYFLLAGLGALILGTFFGLLGSLQYYLPDLFINQLPFIKSRPLHVSLVISWIFLAAIGGVYYYLPEVMKRTISSRLIKVHLAVFLITGTIILACYALGIFGGREYFEYPPSIALLIALSWLLFMINFFKTYSGKLSKQPVYVWMWLTGVIFFLVTFIESNLWQLPFFRDNIVRDLSVQWKALGAMVGSWNMLVYGTAFYVMEKIKGDEKLAHSRISFFFYFLSLTNLMFNWGHHTYIVPALPAIKYTSYIISMTELLILFNIILTWRKSLSEAQKNYSHLPFRLISAADLWIFLNLVLALIISIPEVNYYTHGTHITVAHAMGATIGINTMLLFSSCYFIFQKENLLVQHHILFKSGFWILNVSLFIFWLSLLGAGITKAMEANHPQFILNFQGLMEKLKPFFYTLSLSGLGIFTGTVLLAVPLIKGFTSKIMNRG